MIVAMLGKEDDTELCQNWTSSWMRTTLRLQLLTSLLHTLMSDYSFVSYNDCFALNRCPTVG